MDLKKRDNRLINVIETFFFNLVSRALNITLIFTSNKFGDRLLRSNNYKNFIGLAFFNGLGGLILMLTLIHLASYMGPSLFGSFSYYIALGEIGSMIVRYGRDKSLLRDLVIQDNVEHKAQLISTTFWVGFINLFLFILSIVLLHIPLEVPLCLAPLLIIGGSCLVSLDFQPVYESIQEMSWHAIYNFIQKVIYVIGLWIIMLTYGGNNLLYIGIVLCISWSIVLVIQLKEIKKTFSVKFLKSIQPILLWNHYKIGIYVALCTLISATYNPLIRMILKWNSSETSVGIFSAGLQIYGICMFFLLQLARVANPQIAKMVANNENRLYQKKTLLKYIGYTICAVLPFAIIMDFAPTYIVDLLFSPQYQALHIILPYFGLYLLLYAIIIILMQFLIANRCDRKYLQIQIIGAMVTIISSLILIPKFDYMGAIISLVISYSLLLLLYVISTLQILKKR